MFEDWFNVVSRFTDNIVVFDSSSCVRAKEVASVYIEHKCDGDFNYSFMRNECTKHAFTDWVVHLDVDEYLDLKYLDHILTYTEESAFWLPRFNENKPSLSPFSDKQARIFRRSRHHYEGWVHEVLLPLPRVFIKGYTIIHKFKPESECHARHLRYVEVWGKHYSKRYPT